MYEQKTKPRITKQIILKILTISNDKTYISGSCDNHVCNAIILNNRIINGVEIFCDETDTREYLALGYIMWLRSLKEKRVMQNSGRGLK